MQLNRFMIRPYVEQALREEIGPGDTTGGFLVGDDPVQTGQIYAKGDGVVCGLLLADETIKTVDPDAQVEHMADDGDDMEPGKILLKIRAKASTFFMIERCCARLDSADVGRRDQDATLRQSGQAHERAGHRYPQGLAGTAHAAEIRRAGRRRAQPHLQPAQLRAW